MIGVRGAADLNERFYLTGWAYAGGFGVGSDSMGDIFAGAGYRFTSATISVLGYRWLSVDRDTDDFLYDVTQRGFMLGLSFTF